MLELFKIKILDFAIDCDTRYCDYDMKAKFLLTFATSTATATTLGKKEGA